MSLKAVPALMESLEDDSHTPRKRAWILALLFSIVRERNIEPFRPGETLTLHKGVEVAKQVKAGHEFNVDWQDTLKRRWLNYQKSHLKIRFLEEESPAR